MGRSGIFALLLVVSVPSLARAETECFPPCREGFLCHEGQCVSACNPPCAAGETCTPSGQCVLQHGGGSQTQTQGGLEIVDHSATVQPAVTVVPVTSSGAPIWTPPPQQPAGPPLEPEPLYDNNFAAHVNVLGFLFFGPVLAVEFGAQLAGSVRLRFPQAGLINHTLDFFSDPFSERERSLTFSIAIGGGLRYYLGDRGNLRGFYVGALFEIERRSWEVTMYNSMTFEDEVIDRGADVRATIMGEAGYRFPWSGFLMGFGGQLGLETGDDLQRGVGAFGMVVMELGLYL